MVFIPYPDRSLVRRTESTDEQRASIFNQSYQGIIDNLQFVANTISQLAQQVSAIDAAVTNVQSNYSTQETNYNNARAAADAVILSSTQQNNTANGFNTQVNTSVNKISSANTALTNAENNLTLVSQNAQPYNAFLNALGQLSRPNNSILNISGTGVIGWQSSVGQSFTMEMGYICLDRSLGVLGGSSPIGANTTIPVNTKVFVNMRNAIGLEEVTLNTSTNTITVPCTGNNCTYYVFSLASFCGIGGANSRLMLDSTVVANGSTVQSIAGQSVEANDFNQTSSGFGRFTVGSSSPQLKLESLVQANHPTASGAALGRPVGGSSTLERYASVLMLRRRML